MSGLAFARREELHSLRTKVDQLSVAIDQLIEIVASLQQRCHMTEETLRRECSLSNALLDADASRLPQA